MSCIEIMSVKDSFMKIYNATVDIGKHFMPYRLLSTCFGIGNFPEWQAHWGAFIALPIAAVAAYNLVGESVSISEISAQLFLLSLMFLIVAVIAISTLHRVDSKANDEIVIHIMVGQLMIIALSGPSIWNAVIAVAKFNNILCTSFLWCAPWFYKFITYFPALLFPYFVHRFYDIMQVWPIGYLNLHYNNAFSKVFEMSFSVLYSVFTINIISLMLSGLTLQQLVLFYKYIFLYVHEKFMFLIHVVL